MRNRYLPLVALGTAVLADCGGAGGDQQKSPVGNPNDPTPPATAAIPYLAYERPLVFTVGQLASMIPSAVSPYTSLTISPALPAGLALDGNTGTIAGTATALSPGQPYLLMASNAQGTVAVRVTLEVNDGPFFYSSPTLLEVGTPMIPLTPRGTTFLSGYSVSPALPSGLSLDPSTGAISGTPAEAAPSSYYRITGADAGFGRVFGLTLGVADPAKSAPQTSSAPYVCAHSGGFVGTFSADSADGGYGLIAIAITPDGRAQARVVDLRIGLAEDSDGLEGLSEAMDDTFLIEFPGPSFRQLRGRFQGPDVLAGTYQEGSVSKSFTALRLGGSPAATYRYSGGFGSNNGYRIDFGTVDVTGSTLSVVGYQMAATGADYVMINRQLSAGATISDGKFTVTIDDSTTEWTYQPGQERLALGDPYDSLFYIVTRGCQLK